MKKIVTLILTAAMLVSCVPASFAAEEASAEVTSEKILYFNDFEEDLYTNASVAPKSNSMELGEGKKNVKYLKIAGAGAEDGYFQPKVSGTYEHVVFSMDVSIESGGSKIFLRYRDSNNKDIKLFNTAGGSDIISTATGKSIVELTPDKWVNVAYAVDLKNGTYSAYVKGKLVEENQKLAAETTDKINHVRLYMSKGSKGDLLIDNFAVYVGEEPRDISAEVAAMPEPVEMIGAIASGSGKNYTLDYADMTKLDSGVALLVGNSNAYAKKALTKVDSANEAVMPVIVNSRTLVPVRFISENFGADVSWNETERKVTVTIDGKVIELVIDNPEMTVNGNTQTLDAAATIINDRTMLPLRALVETLGKNVFWDERGLILITDSAVTLDAVKDKMLVTAMYGYLKTEKLALNYAVAPMFNQNIIDEAFAAKDFDYTLDKANNTTYGAIAAKSMYYLTLITYLNPEATSSDGRSTKDEALRRVRYLISGGHEPSASVGAFWSHAVVAAALVLIKNTPVIYDELTADEKDRMDWLMKCLAIAGNWGFNDSNNYRTGFNLLGNFNKTWNPNYRNTYLNVVLSAAMYFGSKELDEIFTSFSYDEYTEKLEELGYVNILSTWKVAGKELMEKGGSCVLLGGSGLSNMKAGDPGGSGAGVKVPFRYNNMTLDNIDGIFNTLQHYVFGAVCQDKYGSPDGEYYCYIFSGKETPYAGYNGMMFEFAANARSSATYCYDSLMTTMAMYTNFKLLRGWDSTEDWQKTLDGMFYIGTEDLGFKLREGYRSYSSASKEHNDHYEYSVTGYGYRMDLDIWKNFHCMGNETITTMKNPNEPVELLPAPEAAPENGVTSAPAGAYTPTAVGSSGAFPKEAALSMDDKIYTKTFKTEFDLTFGPEMTAGYDGVVIFDGSGAFENPVDFKKAHILLQFTGTRINIRNGAKYYATQFPVAANYKYHFRIESDVQNKTYTVWMTQLYPVKGEEVLVIENAAYRAEAPDIKDIGSFQPVQVSKNGSYWIENFIHSGE